MVELADSNSRTGPATLLFRAFYNNKNKRLELGKKQDEAPGYVYARGGAREHANSRSRAKLALLPEHTAFTHIPMPFEIV